jgi:tetratricopeptide (TPR) repeat protein
MKPLPTILIICALLLSFAPGVAPAQELSEADRLAAENLVHSARALIHGRADVPGRAGRIVTLLTAAEAIHPGQPGICRLLSDVYALRDQPQRAADAAAVCLRARPDDVQTGRRWVSLQLAQFQTAEQRKAFLADLLESRELSDVVKAHVAGQLATVLRGQGQTEQAREMFLRALALDSSSPEAISVVLEMEQAGEPQRRVELMGRLHRAQPRNAALNLRWALTLGQLGLHDAALEAFDYMDALRKKVPSPATDEPFLAAWCNALLDAGKWRAVIEKIERRTGGQDEASADWLLPLLEAHRALGNSQESEKLLSRLEAQYRKRLEAEPMTASLATELAWFYLVWKPDPLEALKFARRAQALQPDHPLSRRVLGMALLGGGQTREALELLEPLAAHDAYAAASVAQHYIDTGDKDRAAGIVAQAADVSRSGPGARELLAVAGQLEAKIEPPAAADEARKQWGDSTWLRKIAVNPGQALRITLEPVKETLLPGDAIEVRAILENLTDKSLPLGPEGVLSAVLKPRVVTGSGQAFDDLPLMTWASGGALAPEAKLETKARLDVGALESRLSAMPLAAGSLTVAATCEPIIGASGEAESGQPGLAVEPVALERRSLVEADSNAPSAWVSAYRNRLASLESALAGEDLPGRISAGRQVALLALLARRVDLDQASLPPMLSGISLSEDATALLGKALLNRSPVVRAQVLATLQQGPLSDAVIDRAAGRLGDPSWLVRMRAVELLGAARVSGRRPVLEHFATQGAEHVARMARAFLPSRGR